MNFSATTVVKELSARQLFHPSAPLELFLVGDVQQLSQFAQGCRVGKVNGVDMHVSPAW